MPNVFRTERNHWMPTVPDSYGLPYMPRFSPLVRGFNSNLSQVISIIGVTPGPQVFMPTTDITIFPSRHLSGFSWISLGQASHSSGFSDYITPPSQHRILPRGSQPGPINVYFWVKVKFFLKLNTSKQRGLGSPLSYKLDTWLWGVLLPEFKSLCGIKLCSLCLIYN